MSEFDDLEFGDEDDFEMDEFGDEGFPDEPPELTAEQQKRLAKFQDNVKKAIKVVTNESASVDNRVKAALWLGEAGEPTAIKPLETVYRTAEDKKLKKAAEESLGMYKALQEALEDPEKAAEVQTLLQSIIFEGKMGSVSPVYTLMKRLQVGLAVSFVVLLVVGLAANTGIIASGPALPTEVPLPTQPPSPVPTTSPTEMLTGLYKLHDDLIFDAELLAERFRLATQGRPLECETTEFRMPEAYTPPATFNPDAFPLVNNFITDINNLRTELDTLRAAYDNACNNNRGIPAETVDTSWSALTVLQGQLNTDLIVLLENSEFIPGQIVPLPTDRPEATPFPTPTLEPSVINQHILTVRLNLDEMNQPIIGENNRLIQFWADLETAGATASCRDGTPLLPSDYVISEEDRAELPIDLINAIDAYNFGMTLSRESWQAFEIACAAEEPEIQQGRSKAELAKTSFDEASNLLAKLNE